MIMNRALPLLAWIFLLLLGCSKDSGTGDSEESGNGGKEVSLTLSPSELTFSQAGEEKVFSITTAADWTVTSGSSWCRVNTTGGSGNGSVTVKTDPNEGYSDRTANITVRAGGTTKVLTVTQKKQNALLLTKEKFDVSFAGDTIAVEVKSNVTYTATIPTTSGDWIRQVTLSKALETKTLHFAISANPAADKREGMIIFKENGGTLCDTVHVYQTEKSELVLTKDTCLVASEGATVEVELRTNVDYEVTIPAEAKDWVSLLEGKAVRVDKITLEVQPNTAHDAREARVTIKDKTAP